MTWVTSGESQNFYFFRNETANPFKDKLLTKEVNVHPTVYVKHKFKWQSSFFSFGHTYISHATYTCLSDSRERDLETKPVLGIGEIFPQLGLRIEPYILGRFIILSQNIAYI